MGKLRGILQLTGQLDGLSFYLMNGKIIVRKTGGFDGKKIKQDANYVRVRENGSEFGHCAAAGRYFRRSLHPYLTTLKIRYVHNRVLCLFQAISRLDLVHERGQRRVFQGLQSVEAKQIIAGFEFDKDCAFRTIFPFTPSIHLDEGRLTIPNFEASQLQKVPGATHIQLRFILIGLDFEHQRPFEQQCSATVTVSLATNSPASDLILQANVPSAPFVFGLLHVAYVQRMHGEDYLLQTGGLKVVGYGTYDYPIQNL